MATLNHTARLPPEGSLSDTPFGFPVGVGFALNEGGIVRYPAISAKHKAIDHSDTSRMMRCPARTATKIPTMLARVESPVFSYGKHLCAMGFDGHSQDGAPL